MRMQDLIDKCNEMTKDRSSQDGSLSQEELEKVKQAIDAETIKTEPLSTTDNEDGTVTCEYDEPISVDDEMYVFTIYWVGIDDDQGWGAWSEPVDISKES